jgi:hypothetical protein
MANIKTITLGGAEQEVIISGQNCDIRNDGAEIIYASAQPNVTAGEDGVLAIPVGQAAKLLDSRGKVYLKGTGIAQICGNDYSELVFKSAPAGGGSGGTQDDIARNMASANAASISALRDDVTGIQAIAESVSNENLLINPDFKINQRGLTEYNTIDYTVDGWKITSINTGLSVLAKGVRLANLEATPSHAKTLAQYVEKFADYRGKTLTFSIDAVLADAECKIGIGDGVGVSAVTIGNGTTHVTKEISDNATELRVIIQPTSGSAGYIDIFDTKLEVGEVATPFVPPNPATELAKCQRYLLALMQSSVYRAAAIATDYIDFSITTPTTMRPISGMSIINPENFDVRSINPTVSQEGFSYSVVTYGANQLRLRATKTAHGLTDATLAVLAGKTVLLSAEL